MVTSITVSGIIDMCQCTVMEELSHSLACWSPEPGSSKEEKRLGAIDIESKRYLSNRAYFADAFNYLLYDGKQVIKPEELRELDTTELTVPYGNNAKVPVQKYRDLLKLWCAYLDESAIYVILGAELQNKVHYGMPVKDGLYDMLGYSKQIAEIKRSYQKDDTTDEGELTVDNGVLKIRLTSEEFLSGLRKGDKLIPIITAVVYFGDEPWDGPKSLYDMLNIPNESMKKFIPNYWINLISPADMDDEEFEKFHTHLGFAMKVIKHQSDDADKVIMATAHRKIDSETAAFLNRAVNLKLEYEDEPGGVDMCLAMEKKEKKDIITGVIQGMQMMGASENDIVTKIVEKFNVTREYVLALLSPQKA